jgi:iron complex outermembrane recepter protein
MIQADRLQECRERSGTAKASILTLLLLATASTGTGAAGGDGRLEEVLVTAQKREQSLQDVAVSVTAFTAADIARSQLRDSEEILMKVPNLDVRSNSGSSNANIFLRGVGTVGIGFNLQSGVGIYTDDVALNSPVVNILQVYDLERVEVLRGPQNTLYGRNTTGGAINFISRKPEIGEEMNGFGSVSYGRFNELSLEGALSTPLGDKAAARFAFQSQTRDGIRENLVTGSDDIERDKQAGRVQLVFEPSESVSVNLKAHIERIDADNIRYKSAGAYAPGVTLPDPSQLCATPYAFGCSNGFGFVDSRDEREFSSDMARPINTVDAEGVSAKINIDFENFSLTSITAYEQNEQELSEDSDGYPGHAFHFFLESEQEQVSQEIRVASNSDGDFRWMVGAYGFWEQTSGTTGPTFATPMGIMLVRSDADFDNTSYSAYFNLEYDVAEEVTLRGGFRGGVDTIEGSTVALFAAQSQLPGLDIAGPSFSGQMLPDFDTLVAVGEANGAAVIRVGGPTDPDANINDTDFNEWGAELGVDYRPTDDMLVYGEWSRGYKAGLFPNAPMAIMGGQGDDPIDPEIVNSYEVGVKTEFADGRARFNASIFYTDYTDQQQNQNINGQFEVVSIDSEIWGGEAELTWLPSEGLFVDVGIAMLDTEVTDTKNASQIGKNLVNAPDLTGRVAVRREWQLDSGGLFSIGADARYASKRYFNLDNEVFDGDYVIVDAQGSYEFGPDGRYLVALWGKNLFDEVYFTNGFTFDDNADGFTDYKTFLISPPQTFGVSLQINF